MPGVSWDAEGKVSVEGEMISGVSPLPVQDSVAARDIVPTKDFITKDSGERRVFQTGSQRDVRKGKGRFDLISPIGLRRLAGLYERGAEKYGDHNWERGQPLSSYLDSLLRHVNSYREGDRSEDHICAAAWNSLAYIHTEELIRQGKLPKELDDIGATDQPLVVPAASSTKE